jgi:hypothetical protein
VTPVAVKSPAVLADKDPYNSVKPRPTQSPQPEPEKEKEMVAEKTDTQSPESSTPIPKAIPVEPQEEKPVEIRRAEPVGPLDDAPGDLLLKTETPSPTNDPDQQ